MIDRGYHASKKKAPGRRVFKGGVNFATFRERLVGGTVRHVLRHAVAECNSSKWSPSYFTSILAGYLRRGPQRQVASDLLQMQTRPLGCSLWAGR